MELMKKWRIFLLIVSLFPLWHHKHYILASDRWFETEQKQALLEVDEIKGKFGFWRNHSIITIFSLKIEMPWEDVISLSTNSVHNQAKSHGKNDHSFQNDSFLDLRAERRIQDNDWFLHKWIFPLWRQCDGWTKRQDIAQMLCLFKFERPISQG